MPVPARNPNAAQNDNEQRPEQPAAAGAYSQPLRTPKQKSSGISKVLNHISLCAHHHPPATNELEAISITTECFHCKQVGAHYSKDCPFSCDYCGKRGHERTDCEPDCRTCHGRGFIKNNWPPDPDMPGSPIAREIVAFREGLRGLKEKCVLNLSGSSDSCLIGIDV